MLDSTHRHAEALVEILVDEGPRTSAEICLRLGWPKGRFQGALRYAREHLCPALDLTIPNPTPTDGWQYQVTTDWKPIEAGAAYSMGLVETRLRGIYRDVRTVLPLLEQGSVEWRRANFLFKHLGNITGTLKEINDGEGQARGDRSEEEGDERGGATGSPPAKARGRRAKGKGVPRRRRGDDRSAS